MLFLISVILITAGCETTNNGQENRSSREPDMPVWDGDDAHTADMAWMKTEPIQCLGNDWEKDWLERNNETEDAYPKGKPREIEPVEAAIIQNYFEKQGITVADLDYEPFPEDQMVCEACTCPDGYTLYLQIAEGDRDKMREFGFERASDR